MSDRSNLGRGYKRHRLTVVDLSFAIYVNLVTNSRDGQIERNSVGENMHHYKSQTYDLQGPS